MNLKHLVLYLIMSSLLLVACTGSPDGSPLITSKQEGSAETAVQPPTAAEETLVDEQGAVSMAVTPLDLAGETTTLAFEVAMNTHSVDLSMDLAALATLTTDNGRQVPAVLWDAVPGGHHVSGVLSFPATVQDTAVLEGASRLTLTIRGVDAPERVFTWNVPN